MDDQPVEISPPVSEFEQLDDGDSAPRKRRRRYTAWLWLVLVAGFAGLGALLYYQYGVWLHPIHSPQDYDVVEGYLSNRLAGNFHIDSTEPLRTLDGKPLLRVKYRQKNLGGRWIAVDEVFCVVDGRVAWSQEYHHWKLTPE
jgi:hypothetical protein